MSRGAALRTHAALAEGAVPSAEQEGARREIAGFRRFLFPVARPAL